DTWKNFKSTLDWLLVHYQASWWVFDLPNLNATIYNRLKLGEQYRDPSLTTQIASLGQNFSFSNLTQWEEHVGWIDGQLKTFASKPSDESLKSTTSMLKQQEHLCSEYLGKLTVFEDHLHTTVDDARRLFPIIEDYTLTYTQWYLSDLIQLFRKIVE